MRSGSRPGHWRTSRGYADLVSAVGDRRLVLLGEATHGTHEFLARKQRQPRSKALHLY